VSAAGVAQPIWSPDARSRERSEIARFLAWLRQRAVECAGYPEAWQWSVDELGAFWTAVAEYYDVRFDGSLDPALPDATMPGAVWFPDARVNLAEHLLAGHEDSTAVIAADESGARAEITYGQLRTRVGAVQQGLCELGVARGERVVALMPNRLETLVAFLACAGLGIVWSSCAPEFGTQSVIDRFAQLEPVVLLAVDSYRYGGKRFDKIADISAIREAVPSLREVVVLSDSASAAPQERLRDWAELERTPVAPTFERLPFDHPLWVLYSSGTTGLPKGIVHGQGGILLEGFKQIRLHMDLGSEDRFMWFTTTGWMMWNVVVSGLLSGGTIVLYDGSPTHPDVSALWRLTESAQITYLGLSASFLELCMKERLAPGETSDLSSLRALGSTGSPMSPAAFSWVHDHVKHDMPIFSMSGGTDVCSSFLSASRLLPVYPGELQCRALGVAAEAFDPAGQPVIGEMGELVITQPMPSMPLFLWGDSSDERLFETYFSYYPGRWRHGDWVTFTERGSAIIHGRSDATLNRGGIRMGSGEFYRVVEQVPEVVDSLVVEDGPDATSARLLLFVVLEPGRQLDDSLQRTLRTAIRTAISPRHIPDAIIQTPSLPRTLNGKKLEVPVKRLLSGTPIETAVSLGSVTDPDALSFFVDYASSR
jgi:acetoacetyl-CoA synthetase